MDQTSRILVNIINAGYRKIINSKIHSNTRYFENLLKENIFKARVVKSSHKVQRLIKTLMPYRISNYIISKEFPDP